MVGIVYATRREAAPLLSQTSAVPLTRRPFPTFISAGGRHPPCMVVISGMGKVAATAAAVHLVLAHRVPMLVNAGLCGRLILDRSWSVGTFFESPAPLKATAIDSAGQNRPSPAIPDGLPD
jgi:nucleoside phosphorylase